MKNEQNPSKPAEDLRRKAETIVRENAGPSADSIEAGTPEGIRQMLDELKARQIELEFRNEELEGVHEELEEARARYFELYDLAPVGYFTLSAQGQILEANLTACNLLNVGRGALVNQPFTRFIQNEDQDLFYQHRKRLLETSETQTCELRMVKMDGTPFWAQLISAAQDGGAVPESQVSLIDITTRKQEEVERKKLEELNRLLQKSESLGIMAGAIAHHFNNKLQAVMMNLEFAIKDAPRNSELAESLASAMQSTRMAAEVSSLMLTYLGQTQAKQEPMDLASVCHQAMPLLRAALKNDLELVAELKTPGPVIHANALQIQQCLTNLITNASEASSNSQDAIRLNVTTVAAAEIPSVNRFPIDCQLEDIAYACLEVSDSGCGIASQNIERIFDPFYSTKRTGRGLGLSVVLGIVRLFRGAITVESKARCGSVFRVFFPLSSATVPQKSGPVAVATKMAAVGTVLVVDDEAFLRRALTIAIKTMGFNVLVAKDGLEAVEVFERYQHEIRLVVSDLTMPRMNGWETLAALRQLAPGIPFILCSGYNEALVMEGIHPEMPQAFLPKPYEFKSLQHEIFQVLAARPG